MLLEAYNRSCTVYAQLKCMACADSICDMGLVVHSNSSVRAQSEIEFCTCTLHILEPFYIGLHSMLYQQKSATFRSGYSLYAKCKLGCM